MFLNLRVGTPKISHRPLSLRANAVCRGFHGDAVYNCCFG